MTGHSILPAAPWALAAFLLVSGAGPSARAQTAGTPPPTVDRRAAAFDPADDSRFRGEAEFSGGYAAGSAIHERGNSLGDIDTTHGRVRYTATFIPGGNMNWSLGLDLQTLHFGGVSGGPLPDGLYALSVPLGINWRWTDRLAFIAEVSPGIYTDFESMTSESFNAPVLAGLTYSVNPDLLLVLQLSLDARRDVLLIGGPGVRWRFAERWTLSLILPRPRIEFVPAEGWTLTAGGEIVGGAYQLGDDSGTRRGRPDLDDVNMSYREIRAGIGVFRQLTDRWRLEAGAGWVIDRRFVVDERRLQFNGDGAPYVRLGLTCRY